MSNDDFTHPHAPEFPRAFGKYELLHLLGKGGMGCVYRARLRAGGPDVALKVMKAEYNDDPDLRERFYREYQALSKLLHPGVPPVFEFDNVAGECYFTMAFVPGTPLNECRLTDTIGTVRVLRAVADAVAHAHAKDVIHRDLKPHNVIVRADGSAAVVDFGIALDADTPPEQRLTVHVIGTREYMSPEQWVPRAKRTSARPGPLDFATDVYSFGAMLYWVLTGEVPFAQTETDFLERVRTHPPVPPGLRNPGADPRLCAIALKALAKRPEDRFPSMAAVLDALDAVLRPAPPQPGRARDVRFAFVPPGTVAPAHAPGTVYLDVGNDLRPGVLDHHQGTGPAASTSATGLVPLFPELVRAALDGASDGVVTLITHENPDLDCAASAFLARELLLNGALPPGAGALADYVDRVDAGEPMFTHKRPYTLYSAYRLLTRRLAQAGGAPAALWDAQMRAGHELIAHALAAAGTGSLDRVNPFDAPVMVRNDRDEMYEDMQRYDAKLARPEAHARRAELTLPTPFGTTVRVPALFARDVQNEGDADRCSFFKDWARGDDERCPTGEKTKPGFVATCVWESGPVPRCVVSVRPDSDARLNGLAAALDEAETRVRAGTQWERTGPPRGPGYANSDPWYDGRAHNHTIIDAPRSGTKLSADEVERIVLTFAAATAEPL
jgi:serine/threonine protein kinase